MKTSKIRTQLAVTTAIATALFGYGGRRAYAACAQTAAPNYLCSGAETTAQNLPYDNANVYTDNTFSVTGASGYAINISAQGNLAFTDTFAATVTGDQGLHVNVTGDDPDTGLVSSIIITANSHISTTAGAGIVAQNHGTGDTDIDFEGHISAHSTGLYAANSTGGGDLGIKVGATAYVYSDTSTGVYAHNHGLGSTTLDIYGKVAGYSNPGIEAHNLGTDLTINAATGSAIKSHSGEGIRADNQGSGDLTVWVDSDVSSDLGRGILAGNTGGDLSVTVGSHGDVEGGGDDGIRANQNGTGAASVSVSDNGSVSSDAAAGIIMFNNTGASALIQTGQGTYVSGATAGITLLSYTVTATASVIVDGYVHGGTYGIIGTAQGDGLSILADNSSDINSDGVGIAAQLINTGTGKLDVTVNGMLTAVGNGIFASNSTGSELDITTDDDSLVKSTGAVGIYAVNTSSAASMTVSIDGDVDAHDTAISAADNAADIIIKTGAKSIISSDTGYGIHAVNQNTGDLSITVGYALTSYKQGIFAHGYAHHLLVYVDEDATITSTHSIGIDAYNKGIGATYLNIDGDIDSLQHGIKALNAGNTGNLTIYQGQYSDITSSKQGGIFAGNKGTSGISLNLYGTIESYSEGAYAYVKGPAGVFVTTGKYSSITSAHSDGISAHNFGHGGSTYVTVGGEVSGYSNAINVSNSYSDSGNITVLMQGDSAATSAQGNGIFLSNNGAGKASLSIYGSIDAYSTGIYAYASGSELTITTGSASDISSSNTHAINAKNKGIGALSVDIGHTVEAYDSGVYARNYGTTLTVTTEEGSSITASNGYAIRTFNHGTGGTSLDIGGTLSGAGNAIYAFDDSAAGGVTVTTGKYSSITSATNGGIHIFNQGDTGKTVATLDGYISGVQDGVSVWQYSTGTTDVSVGADGYIVATGGIGLVVQRYAASATTVTVEGKIDGSSGALAVTTTTAGDVTIKLAKGSSVTSDNGFGVGVNGASSTPSLNAISVTVDGDITSKTGGINVRNNYFTDGVTVQTGKYSHIDSSTSTAIYVDNLAGAISMTLGGEMSGGDFGIRTISDGATTSTDITLESTASASGQVGLISINYSAGPVTITVDSGATVYGSNIGLVFAKGGNATINTSGDISTSAGGVAAIAMLYLTDDAALNIYGGHITGAILSNDPTDGFSHVNIKSNFTSEGDINVSDFNVAAGATFTLGKGFTVSSSTDPIDIYGTFVIPEDPAITGDMDVHAGGSLDVHDVTTITGFLKNEGTASISHDGSVEADTMQAAAKAGTMYFGVYSTSDHALLTIDSGAADLTNQTIKIDVGKSASFSATDQIKIIDGTTKLINGPGSTLVDVWESTPAWDFKIVDGSGIGGSDSDLYLVLQANAPPPSLDGAIAAATLTLSDSSLNITSERLSELRGNNGGMTGVSAGGSDLGSRRVWTQALGQYIHQGERQGVSGYTAKLMGGTIGADTDKYLRDGVLGLAFSYGQSSIDAMNDTRTAINIDSYQLTLYGDYNWPKGWYTSGMAAYSFNSNDSTRHNAGGAGLNAYADFNSQQAAARGEIGRSFNAGKAFFTPFAVTNWVYYTAQNYTETGAGAGNLHVENKDLNQVDLGIGGRAGINLRTAAGELIRPELHALYRRDLLGDSLETSQAYIGSGAPAFAVSSPDPARDKYTLGAQVKYYGVQSLELTAAYDLELKEDYVSHTGLIRAGWRF